MLGKTTMAGPYAKAIQRVGGKVGGLQADPAKQLPGGPCKCRRAQSTRWFAAGMQCNACRVAADRERKRKAQQAEKKGHFDCS